MMGKPDKYEVPSDNLEVQFVDEERTVLVNKPGIMDLETLQVAEEEALVKAYQKLLTEVRTDTPMSCDLLKHIHACIFAGLYEWAGRWRTVQISKPGAIWPPPDYLDESMATFEQDVLKKYSATMLTDDEKFCQACGEIQGEFLAIHPFREGNARTIKLMTDLLSVQTGGPLLVYDTSEDDKNAYIDAAKAALLKRNYQPLIDVIQQALTEGRKYP